MSRAHRTSFWSAAASEARRRFPIAYAPRSTPKRRRRCALPANSKTLSACSRFLKSCNLQHRTRIGAMNLFRKHRTSNIQLRTSSNPLSRGIRRWVLNVRCWMLPAHGKLLLALRMHWDHELIFRGSRERLRRALIVSSGDAHGRSGLDGVSPCLWYKQQPVGLRQVPALALNEPA